MAAANVGSKKYSETNCHLCKCQFTLTFLACSLQGLCSYDQYRCGTPLTLMSPGLGMGEYL